MGTIDDYLTGLDEADAAVIGDAYDIARDVVPDATQGSGYGMPALVYRGKSLLSVMRAKSHIGVYPFSPAAIVAIEDLLVGVDAAKGTVRFPPAQALPAPIIRGLVAARRAQIDQQLG